MLDEKFRKHWKNYLVQCLIATFVIFLVILILNIGDAVIIAAIGSTTFVVFAMPKSLSANPRNVVGGYTVGLFCGSLFGVFETNSDILSSFLYASAVGLSIFIMVITDTEHPPASGVALGVAISGFSINISIAVILSAILLSLVHFVFKPYFEDLA